MGGRGLSGSLQDSGRHRWSVASASSPVRWNSSHGCPQPSIHGGEGLSHRTRVVVDGFVMVCPGLVLADQDHRLLRTRCDVLRVAFRVGSGVAGEQAVRLQPKELRPGRADPAWRWAEACRAPKLKFLVPGKGGGKRDSGAHRGSEAGMSDRAAARNR
jgi:hypothetical protein